MKYYKTTAFAVTAMVLFSTSHAGNLRIVGGSEAQLEQYPWIAGLVNRGGAASNVFCGASVISPSWVLTAAHCLEGESTNGLEVLLNTDNLNQLGSAERIPVSRVVVHPEYQSGAELNDIALIKLSRPTTVEAIALSSASRPAVEQQGESVSVAGWGNLSGSGSNYSAQLHAVTLEISDFSRCSQAYGGLDDTQICAAVPQGGKDSCQGDSGGPLIARTSGGAVQVGIVSFGEGCGVKGYPGVYTKVSQYSSFLAQADADMSVTDGATPDSPVDNSGDANDQNESDVESIDVAEEDSITDPVTPAPPIVATVSPIAETVELSVLESFGSVQIGGTGIATIELYNPSAVPLSVTDVQVGLADGVDIAYEDCTDLDLGESQACYIDLLWTPSAIGDLAVSVSLGVAAGGAVETLVVDVPGTAQSMAEFGAAVDMSEADFDTDHAEPWNQSSDNPVQGDIAIETVIETDEPFWLTGQFNNEEAMTLTFDYLLSGASCVIYIDDEAAYELAVNDRWESAKIEVPAGADVNWHFNPYDYVKTNGRVRFDNFRKSAPTMTAVTAMAVSGNDENSENSLSSRAAVGAGSIWVFALLCVMLGIRARRSVGSKTEIL